MIEISIAWILTGASFLIIWWMIWMFSLLVRWGQDVTMKTEGIAILICFVVTAGIFAWYYRFIVFV